jgi:hypothetical protein
LQELEQKGIRYGDIVTFFEKRGHPQSFYSPSGLSKVEGMLPGSLSTQLITDAFFADSQTPDIAIWVVDGSDSLTWAASAEKLAALLSSGELQTREKLIIAVNKM